MGDQDSNNERPANKHSQVIQKSLEPLGFNKTLGTVSYCGEDESDDDESIVTLQAAGLHPQSRSNHLVSPQKQAFPAPQVMRRFPFEPFDLEQFEISEHGLVFCPFKLVTSYPYQYLANMDQDKVGSFFKTNVLDNRAWDMFYLHDPYSRRDPLVLVPTVQFEQFLKIANWHLHAGLAIPGGVIPERFSVVFGELGSPRPRFAGRIMNENDYRSLKEILTDAPRDNLGKLEARSLELFKKQMDRIYDSLKSPNSKKKNLEAKRIKKLSRQKDWGRITKRVQRYLGLRQRAAYTDMAGSPDTSWTVDRPIQFQRESSVKFVCVDAEAYERNNNIVTEIGIATLDTGDIGDVPPGENGKNWFSLIKAHHLRINEVKHLYNHEFVQSCPESFNFGESESVRQRDAAQRVGAIVEDGMSDDRRTIVVVGHDIASDLRYLWRIGYNMWNLPWFMDEVDTKSMFQRAQLATEARSLQHVCSELDIPGRDFHNAGNDAVYTLRAMIAIAIKKKVGGPQTASEVWASRSLEDINIEDWSDGEQDDGGPAVKSLKPV